MTPTMYLLIVIALAVVLVAVAIWFADAARVFFRYRGSMLFTCPETRKAACVKVAAADAARSSLTGRLRMHLSECSRWPQRQNCGQKCLSQLGADPQNCLLWTKVCDWYRGRACAYCRKPFLELQWHDHRPALLSPESNMMQWSEVAPEQLPELFETHLPVCWNCYIAETFRRQYPERVVDRPSHRGPMGEFLVDHEKQQADASSTTSNGVMNSCFACKEDSYGSHC
jgi:hypothetical protein